MYENIEYKASNGKTYIINGDAPDLFDDFSHKVMLSIENKTNNNSFTYYISVSHPLWEMNWKINPESEELTNSVKEFFLEKAKRLIDSGKEEYLDVTMTPLNTPKDLTEAIEALKV
ncbi:MAG: hypothetical protein AB7V50_06880 [Vampirovibrionia bacterium]